MQPNIITDVESIIQIALIFEKIDPRRLLLRFDGHNISTSSPTVDPQSPILPNSYTQKDFLLDLARVNSSGSGGKEAEMAVGFLFFFTRMQL
jgi:hypothetical protein